MSSSSSSSSSIGNGTQSVWAFRTYGSSIDDYRIETQQIPSLTLPNDILVQNYAVSLNPTDDKQRGGYGKTGTVPEGQDGIVSGRDASGVVVRVGKDVTKFKVGDSVWYAGSNVRPGSFSQFTLVDSRIASLKPSSLTHQEAAALPLAAITVWEGLYEKILKDSNKKGQKILITAGAGGVGSLAVQLSLVWGLSVWSTSSRAESSAWLQSLGVEKSHILDHSRSLKDQIDGESGKFDIVFHCHDDSMLEEVSRVVKPRGHIISILPFYRDNNAVIRTLFAQSVSLHFELMFSRPAFGYELDAQGELLSAVAALVDQGKIKTTKNKVFEWTEFKEAFALLASGKTIGKTVVKVPQLEA